MSTADTLTLTGYASVVEVPYLIGGEYVEVIARGAFKRTLNDPGFDCQLLINHQGLPLATVRSGTLRLSEDQTGLHVSADLDKGDPDVQSLAPKLLGGLCTEMSFAFRATEQSWNSDYSERRVIQLDMNRGDVSCVSYGANASTSVSLRSRERLGSRTAQSRLPLEARRQRAAQIGQRVAFTGRIASIGGQQIRARSVTYRSHLPIPNHTATARLRFAALEHRSPTSLEDD